ncbi:hypothetical protein [Oryzifoliimicrobium ureilyticus]|uniref:hypothetical protein n=1 Tax=Oryzifoliimicrobium ureilyticus TaxID=3113724 RepID=UPI003075FA9B
MYKLAIAVSLTLLASTSALYAQSNLNMDSSGRFDGSPPLGTSTDQESSGLAIPLDGGITGSTSSDSIIVVQPERCRDIRRGQIRASAQEREVCRSRR